MQIINTAALPRIAVLRKGAEMTKAANGNTKPGQDLDHFRVDFTEPFAHHADLFARMYGDQPKEIPGLRFLDEGPFSFYFERWGGNHALQVRHDGQHYVKRWTAGGYDFTADPISAQDADPKACVPVGRLTFILEDFFRETGEVGLFTALTGSPNDRDTIQAYFAFLRAMRISLMEVPFTLRRVPREFTVEIKGKPSQVTKYMWQLTAGSDEVRALLPSNTNPRTGEITGGNRPALPSGDSQPTHGETRYITGDEGRALIDYAHEFNVFGDDLLNALQVDKIASFMAYDPLQTGQDMIDAWVEAHPVDFEMPAAMEENAR